MVLERKYWKQYKWLGLKRVSDASNFSELVIFPNYMRSFDYMNIKCWDLMRRILWIVNILAVMGMGVAAADEDAVRQSVEKLLPGMKIEQAVLSPIPGLYEVTAGSRIFYVSADGHYLLHGNLLDLHTRKDLTEARQGKIKKAALDKLSETQMVVFSPEHPKHTITVFTDIDCGYCRKLHQEIGEFMAEGIKVRYLLFPRAGIGSPSYTKAVSVWCSANRNQAMTDAKAGKPLPNLTCDNPVQDHMKFGELMGVTGTPTIVLENGRILPGYVPAKSMGKYLNDPER
jgi:thiol:disulfide interchange protein DsbC